MNRKYLTLTSRINEELSGLKRIVLRIQKAYECAEKSNDDLYLDSVALNLHGFYSAMENIFELIAKNVDQTIPDGELWHQELLKQMLRNTYAGPPYTGWAEIPWHELKQRLFHTRTFPPV